MSTNLGFTGITRFCHTGELYHYVASAAPCYMSNGSAAGMLLYPNSFLLARSVQQKDKLEPISILLKLFTLVPTAAK